MSQVLLRQAFNQIPTYGFTRRAIAHSIPTPLSETAISSLFGPGDAAQRTLIQAWLNEGRMHMSTATASKSDAVSMQGVLLKRLEWNKPVLPHLKDAFALMASSSTRFLPIVDVRPALEHAFGVADEACYLLAPPPNGSVNWYTRRLGIAGVYAAAELHQLASPSTAPDFLLRLLEASLLPSQAIHEIGLLAEFGVRGWAGMLKGRGLP